MKKIFLFIILALYGYTGSVMGYRICNDTDGKIRVVVWIKKKADNSNGWDIEEMKIKSNRTKVFHFKTFSHVDIKVREHWYSTGINKTIKQPDKKFFDRSNSKTISVYKKGDTYKVRPE